MKFRKGIVIPLAALLVGAAFVAAPAVTYAAAPTGSSAVVASSTTSTVAVLVTGTDFTAFVSASSTTANATDLAKVTYRSVNPTAGTIVSSTVVRFTFPISIGTDKSGSFTIATSTLRDATTPNSFITIANGSVTDLAAPQYSSSMTIDNDGDGTVDFIRVTYTEALSDASVAAGDFAAGIATTTSGALTESFTSATPASGVYTDTANDATVYVGVTSGSETISTNKTDYTLLIQGIGSVSDAASNALATSSVATSTDGAAPKVVTDTLSGLTGQTTTVEPSYTFSEAMATTSLTASNSLGTTFTQTWSNGDMTVTLNHAAAFTDNESITTTLSAGTAAAGSNTTLLGLPYSSSFSTAAASGGHHSSGGGGGGGSHSSGSSSDTSGTGSTDTATRLAALLEQLHALQAQLGTTPTGGSTGSFTRDLTIGSQGEDVRALQVFLNAHGFAVAESGPGSKGNETTLFGSLTQAALAKWQASVGISPAAGYFGPKTRAAITATP